MIMAANDLRQIVVWAAKLLNEGIEKFKNKTHQPLSTTLRQSPVKGYWLFEISCQMNFRLSGNFSDKNLK